MTDRANSCFNEPNWAYVEHIASASQISTWLMCQRKWWFGKGVERLTELDKGYLTFGTVTHAVIERWMNADDLGNDTKTGKPVDLYPEGWEKTQSRDKKSMVSVDIAQQELIKKLIPLAIAEGILVRTPGRQLEKKFYLPVLTTDDGGIVWIMGFIDMLLDDEIHDHKTTSNMRYALSPKKLKVNPQMLIYAMVILQRCHERGIPTPEQVTVRHNVFCKDTNKPVVRKTSAQIEKQAILDYWDEVKRICGRMVRQLKVKDWHDMPGSEESSEHSPCSAYGGCAFIPICSGEETPEDYRKRVARIQEARVFLSAGSNSNATPTSTEGSNTVNVFEEKMAARKAAQDAIKGGTPPAAAGTAPPVEGSQAPPTAPTPAPAAQPQQPAPTPGVVTTDSKLAPWGIPGCTVCQGGGFNATGNPCRICDSKQAVAKRMTSEMYVIEPLGDGTFVWEVKPEYAELAAQQEGTGAMPETPPAEAASVEEKTPTPPEQDPVVEEEPAPEDGLIPDQTIVVWMYRNKPTTGTFTKHVKGGIQARRHNTGKNSKVNEGEFRLATPEEVAALLPETPVVPPVIPPVAATVPQIPPVAPVIPAVPAVAPAAPAVPPVAPPAVPPAAQPETPPAAPSGDSAMAEIVNPKRAPGRPAKGFTLCINCSPTKGGNGSVLLLDDILQRYGELLAAKQGVNSFFMLDDFKRRNAVAHAAPVMAEEFGTNVIVVRGHTQDIRALTDALRPFAEIIFEGMA